MIMILMRSHGAAEVAFNAFMYSFPNLVTFLAPVATGFGAVTAAARLTRSGEIDAMKMCGINLWRLVLPILGITVLVAGFSLFLNVRIAPDSHFARRVYLLEAFLNDPLSFIREGKFVNTYQGYRLYVGGFEAGHAKDVVIIDERAPGKPRVVRAAQAEISTNEDNRGLHIVLREPEFEVPDPDRPDNEFLKKRVRADTYEMEVDVPDTGRIKLVKKISDLRAETLLQFMRGEHPLPEVYGATPGDVQPKAEIEFSQRIALGAACIAFPFLGIAVGLRNNARRPMVYGPLVILLLVFAQYLFIGYAETLYSRPESHPHLVMWLPVLACFLVSVVLVHRAR